MVAGHGSQVPVDGPLQCERADLGVELDQAGDLVGVSGPSRQETLEGGSRGVVEPPRPLPTWIRPMACMTGWKQLL